MAADTDDTADADEQGRLHEVAAGLYGLRPDRFTAARTAAALEARDAGDKALAAEIKGLRRPTVAAYVVNLLARDRAELVEQVVSLGEALREAQASLQGDALRELSRQRRQLVAAVAQEARTLATAKGQNVTDSVVRQVEDTLNAAMTAQEAADAVSSGLLAQPLSSTGLESLGDALAVPAPGQRRTSSGRALRVVPPPDDDEAERRAAALAEAQQALADAEEALAAATRKRDKTVTKKQKAEARLLQLEARLEELRQQVAQVESEAESAADEVESLEAKHTKAESKVERAESAVTEARAVIRELDES